MSIFDKLGIRVAEKVKPKSVVPVNNVVAPIISEGARLLIVGEAPGEHETMQGHPFAGASGYMMASIGCEAGLFYPKDRSESMRQFWVRNKITLTNVIWERPEDNNFNLLTCTKREFAAEVGCKQTEVLDKTLKIGGRYIKPSLTHYVDKLRDLIIQTNPNLILAVGGKALTALCGLTSIKRSSGYTQVCTLVPGYKVLPILHPAAVMRDYGNEPLFRMALIKAAREVEFPEVVFDEVTVIVQPSFEEVLDFFKEVEDAHWPQVAADIETLPSIGLITDISIALSDTYGISIPFFKDNNPYWTLEQEVHIWLFIFRWLELSRSIIWHNGTSYDVQWMRDYCRRFNVRPYSPWDRNALEDTLQLHHAIHPEMGLALNTIGSYLLNRPQWKHLRARAKEKLKMDE